VPRLCEFYPGICLTTEEKAQKNLSQGKRNLSQSTVCILPKHPLITLHYFAHKYHKAIVLHVKCNKIQIRMAKMEFYIGYLKERNNSWLTHCPSKGTFVSLYKDVM